MDIVRHLEKAGADEAGFAADAQTAQAARRMYEDELLWQAATTGCFAWCHMTYSLWRLRRAVPTVVRQPEEEVQPANAEEAIAEPVWLVIAEPVV